MDLISFAIKKKFVIGVAKYLVWPETHISQKITSTHHIWFIPIVGYVIKVILIHLIDLQQGTGLRFESYIVAVSVTICLWLTSRLLVPKTLAAKGEKEHDGEIYLNLNLSWELWKDVKSKFLARLASGKTMF